MSTSAAWPGARGTAPGRGCFEGGERWILATASRSCWAWEGDGPVLVPWVSVGTALREAKGAGEERRAEWRLFFIQLWLTR